VRGTGTPADWNPEAFVRVMVTWGTAGFVDPDTRMKPPWATLVAFTATWMAGPGGRVVAGGGPVVATAVATVVWVGAAVVSTVVAGEAVVTGAGVMVAGGKVTKTMVGVEGLEEVLSFRR
jgi:hypothetical protein